MGHLLDLELIDGVIDVMICSSLELIPSIDETVELVNNAENILPYKAYMTTYSTPALPDFPVSQLRLMPFI